MEFYKENKVFVYSCIFASGCSLYMLIDILKKIHRTNKAISKSSSEKNPKKSTEQKPFDLSVPTPTKLHPYQQKLANYTSESNFFPQKIQTTGKKNSFK